MSDEVQEIKATVEQMSQAFENKFNAAKDCDLEIERLLVNAGIPKGDDKAKRLKKIAKAMAEEKVDDLKDEVTQISDLIAVVGE